MAEHTAQPEVKGTVNPELVADRQEQQTPLPVGPLAAAPAPIIWTPSFIVIFALVLALGLSVASILVQGYLNNYYSAESVLLVFDSLLLAYWIALIVRARSEWVRVGGLFGCIWSLFSAMNLVVSLLPADPVIRSTIAAHLHAATSISLLGSFICLSISRTPLTRWDNWCFILAPILCVCIILIWFLRFSPTHSLKNLENSVAIVLLFASLATWWLRPSCWQHQPGPTFLFGLVPLIQLWITLPGTQIVTGEIHFFYSQVAQLCILLAIMRLVQGEVSYAGAISHKPDA